MPKRYSKKRQAIIECLRSTDAHPSAEWIYARLKPEHPDLSLGTVYRNLALLCELGEIKKIPCGDGSERYDGFVDPHNHFVCSECGKVIDLTEPVSKCETKVKNKDIGCVNSYSLIYYGLCKECLKNKK